MSLFTEGKLFNIANAESGGGSGDQHNLGWYATQAELEEAHPTATAGDWAIVGSTDTVWIWDTDNDEWTDSGAKSPTYTAGNGISITNNEISVTDPVLVNKDATNSVIIAPHGQLSQGSKGIVLYAGSGFVVTGTDSVAINSSRTGTGAICINGFSAKGTNAIQLGGGVSASNPDANTFKVGNANGNFELLSADGTIPAARHAALPSADGTYVLKLVIANGVPTLSWVAE